MVRCGLTALNVSVDSLDPRQFHQITGENKLAEVMAGIDAALVPVSVGQDQRRCCSRGSTIISSDAFLAWIRDKPIELRFIELMQTGEMDALFRDHHTSGELIKQRLQESGWVQQLRGLDDGPAQVFTHPGLEGRVGLIMPYSRILRRLQPAAGLLRGQAAPVSLWRQRGGTAGSAHR